MMDQIEITSADLNKIRNFVFKETGIFFESKKDYYLKSRVQNRIKEIGVKSFKEYYHTLVFGNKNNEVLSLIEEITINETYFFRDFPQLRGFAEEVLPLYLDQKRMKKDFSLKIWSAACSSGEEPYTLSIIVQEMIEDFHLWKIRIDATDIDRRALRKAKLGLYGERSMKDTPLEYRAKYFEKFDDSWRVLPNVKKYVTFEQLNLIDRSRMRKKRGYDFIFCRNVLIYFNETTRKKVLSYLYDALLSGGYIFLGHSESVGRMTAAFLLERKGDFLCYKKP